MHEMSENVDRADIFEMLLELEVRSKALDIERPELSLFVTVLDEANRIINDIKHLNIEDDALLERSFSCREGIKTLWSKAEANGLMSRAHLDSLVVEINDIGDRIFKIFESITAFEINLSRAKGGKWDQDDISVDLALNHERDIDKKLSSVAPILGNELAEALAPFVEVGLLPPDGPAYSLEFEKSRFRGQQCVVLQKRHPILGEVYRGLKYSNSDELKELRRTFGVHWYPELALNEACRSEYLESLRNNAKEHREVVLKHARKQCALLIELETHARNEAKSAYGIFRGRRVTSSARTQTSEESVENAIAELSLTESIKIYDTLQEQLVPLLENPLKNAAALIEAPLNLYPDVVLQDVKEMEHALTDTTPETKPITRRASSFFITATLGVLGVAAVLSIVSKQPNGVAQPTIAAAHPKHERLEQMNFQSALSPPAVGAAKSNLQPECLKEGVVAELEGFVTTHTREVYGEVRNAYVLNVEEPACVMVDMGGERTGETSPASINRFHLTYQSDRPEGIGFDQAEFKKVRVVGKVTTGNYSQSYTEPNAINVRSIRVQ